MLNNLYRFSWPAWHAWCPVCSAKWRGRNLRPRQPGNYRMEEQ